MRKIMLQYEHRKKTIFYGGEIEFGVGKPNGKLRKERRMEIQAEGAVLSPEPPERSKGRLVLS